VPGIAATSPATGQVLKVYEKASAADIGSAMERARRAFLAWHAVPLEQRLRCVRAIRSRIVEELDTVADTIALATGKVRVEALMADVLPVLELAKYYERNAPAILKPRIVKTPLLYMGSTSLVTHEPAGVVLVIAPWNYPFQLAMGPILTALVSGSVVILKPSELTLTIGELIVDVCSRAGLPEHAVQAVYGDGETGVLLVDAGPDRIFLTGSTPTGRRVMEATARNLTPLVMELGGRDPMIVFDDANFPRAIGGALYGAFANSGQVCVSVRRLYVQQGTYEPFVHELAERATQLRIGFDTDSDIGAVASLRQIELIDACVDDALARGARLLTSRERRGNLLRPIILANTNHDMRIMREEVFGSVLPVMPFETEEQAVDLANDCSQGLGSSIWTPDLPKARRVAERLRAGSCAVNDVIKTIGNPYLPFGGVKLSGFGRYHGPDGLYALSEEMSLMVNPGTRLREVNWFPYRPGLYDGLKEFIGIMHGPGSIIRKAAGLLAVRRYFRKHTDHQAP